MMMMTCVCEHMLYWKREDEFIYCRNKLVEWIELKKQRLVLPRECGCLIKSKHIYWIQSMLLFVLLLCLHAFMTDTQNFFVLHWRCSILMKSGWDTDQKLISVLKIEMMRLKSFFCNICFCRFWIRNYNKKKLPWNRLKFIPEDT